MDIETKKILKISILTAVIVNLVMPSITNRIIPFIIEKGKSFPCIYTTAASGDDSIFLFFSIIAVLLNLSRKTVKYIINYLLYIWSKVVYSLNDLQHKWAYRILHSILIVVSIYVLFLYLVGHILYKSYEHKMKQLNISIVDSESLNRLWGKMKTRNDYKYICYLIGRYSEGKI